MAVDVAIIGGGPAGSTMAALLRTWAPDIEVLVLERERFPREHVGESQLPPIGEILEEMGCWDDVEAAGFPIKIGATYRWGASDELWDFEFLPVSEFKDEARPAKFVGQRRHTAFQVERAKYDDILLRRAAQLGAEVRQETGVRSVEREGDRVTGLVLDNGERIEATHYVDASGHAGILRRAMGVEVDCPTELKNVAVWQYWDNAEWAIEIGVGGTRVQVMSVGFGWVWFIPVSPTKASVGLVCPAAHLSGSGKTLNQLYDEALECEPRIRGLLAAATPRDKPSTTKDWSFLAERATGENWMLVGEAIGFADPILAAGMTLAQTGAREAAYIVMSLHRGEHDRQWLLDRYSLDQRTRIRQHIRFADFWYATNGQFSDLQEHCAEIAKEAGLSLDPEEAWAWLARGGFTHDVVGQASVGGLSLSGVRGVGMRTANWDGAWEVSRYTKFQLNLKGAEKTRRPVYEKGRIRAIDALRRGNQELPVTRFFALLLQLIPRSETAGDLAGALQKILREKFGNEAGVALQHAMEALELMVVEGWVVGQEDPTAPRLSLSTPREGGIIHTSRDG